MSMDDIYNILSEIRGTLSAISQNLNDISVVMPSGSDVEIGELNDTMKEIRDILREIANK